MIKVFFIEEVTEQFYDEESNQFLADRYLTGECPNCGKDGAYGDQCESCGRTLSPSELINPKSVLTGNVTNPESNYELVFTLRYLTNRLFERLGCIKKRCMESPCVRSMHELVE